MWTLVKALLLKNLRNKTRRPHGWLTAQELFIIAELALLSIALKSLRSDVDAPLTPSTQPETIDAMATYLGPLQTTLLFAPDTTFNTDVVNRSLSHFGANSSVTTLAGFASATEMLSSYAADAALRTMTAAAILFDESGLAGNFTIALPRPSVGETSPRDLSVPPLAAERLVFDGYDDSPSWFWSGTGYSAIQHALDRGLADALGGTLQPADVAISRMPLAPYRSSYRPGSRLLEYLLPIYATFPLALVCGTMLTSLVMEKESKLSRGLVMMGMPVWVHFLSWWIVYAALLTLAATVMTVAYAGNGFFPNSDYFLLWCTLELAALAIMAFNFWLSALLKSKSAAQPIGFFVPMIFMGAYAGIISIEPASTGLLTGLCIFPHIAAPAGVLLFIEAESRGGGLGWSQMLEGGSRGPSLLGVWGFLAFEAILLMLYAVIVERRGPGATPMPSAPGDGVAAAMATAPTAAEESGQARGVVRVAISRLGRAFTVKKERIAAVRNLELEMREGEVLALLGQNGAGKTTTIDMLTGMISPSEGDATIFGHSIRKEMDAIHALSGICPQHDLVFASLTVAENIELVAIVKGLPSDQMESAREVLLKVGLNDEQLHKRTNNLSGGQKRKLSLACALVGSPKFILLDEPTAGMDPKSRRTVWSAISESKPGAAVLLTTHFMDEADALGDAIAVMHKSRLRAVGTPSNLKERFGKAYRLTFACSSGVGASSNRLLDLVRSHVAAATVIEQRPEEVSIALPIDSAASFASLFDHLDRAKSSLAVTGYGLSIPTMQEVFMQITDAADSEDAAAQEHTAAQESANGGVSPTVAPTLSDHEQQVKQPALNEDDLGGEGLLASSLTRYESTPAQQYWMGMRLSALSLYQDYAAWLSLGIPGIVIFLIFLLPPVLDTPSSYVAPNTSDPSLLLSTAVSAMAFAPTGAASSTTYPLPYAPTGAALAGEMATIGSAGGFGFELEPLPSATALNDSLLSFAGAVGAYDLSAPTSATLFYNASMPGSIAGYLTLLDKAALSAAGVNATLEPRAALLPYIGDEPPPLPSPLAAAIVPPALTYALLFVGLVFVNILVKDRLVEKTTHQLLVMGLSPKVRWLMHLSFWTGVLYAFLALGLIVILAFGAYPPTAAAAPAFLLLLLFVAPSFVLFTSIFNFLFFCKLSSSQDVDDVVGQVVCNVGSLVALWPSLLVSAIPGVRDSVVARWVFIIVQLLTPLGQMSAGLSAIYQTAIFREYERIYAGKPAAVAADYLTFVTTSPLDGSTNPGTLLCILISLATIPIWYVILYRIDVRRYYYARRTTSPSIGLPVEDKDPDVAAERRRVEAGESEGSVVRMVRLRRTFPGVRAASGPEARKKPPPKVAVDSMSLAIDGSGCFALLGPNGAGKTTTLQMLTGDLRPTDGDAYVCGYSIRTHLMEIFKRMGYCPQFGGLYMRGLTLQQQLEAYGRLKGIRPEDLPAHVAGVLADFGLEDHKDKWAKSLSGGTRRKLITAISLACDPKVCFLDEPTTGVDVGTRQFIWDRIRAKGRQGTALILTTHYMEEADALANRIGIMLSGRLRVLGSPQHLKVAHGGGYRVELRGRAEAAKESAALVHRLFPGAVSLEHHDGYQVFEAPPGEGGQSFALGEAFKALDDAKSNSLLDSYSLSQATLESVFLKIVQQEEEPAQPELPEVQIAAPMGA